jgi:hypothetical protein
MEMLRMKGLSPLNARAAAKVHRSERLFLRGVIGRHLRHESSPKGQMDNQPKPSQPEIMPPVPKVESGRGLPEIPPDKDAPEKTGPTRGGK